MVKAAGGKGDVAHEFGVEAETGLTGEQFVERVRQFEVGAGERRLAVGGRGDDEPVDRLHAPVLRDEFGGEPVEQLGVAGQ